MQVEPFDVKDQVAVVTGATGVLGGAIAEGYARQGMRVAILGRNADKGNAVVQRIRESGGEAEFTAVDVTSRESCEDAARQVLARFGQVDVLVNSAGGNRPDATATDELSFFDLSDDGLQQVLNLNAMGTVIPCQVFGASMAARRQGSIINISSMAAMTPLTRVVGYSAAKAAVSNFTQWLSVYMCQNFGPELRVNAVAPGFFLTEQNRFLLTEQSGALTARGQQIVEHTPMGRFGEADELVGTLVWLASPASEFVTGIVVPVDGGFSAFSGV
ncbi:MAG: D-mannonate oxidoreductase [Planctomycetaceae bacterium]|nr:D-mannonate oxidoreductase [Planctomycetaceae bacterium]